MRKPAFCLRKSKNSIRLSKKTRQMNRPKTTLILQVKLIGAQNKWAVSSRSKNYEKLLQTKKPRVGANKNKDRCER